MIIEVALEYLICLISLSKIISKISITLHFDLWDCPTSTILVILWKTSVKLRLYLSNQSLSLNWWFLQFNIDFSQNEPKWLTVDNFNDHFYPFETILTKKPNENDHPAHKVVICVGYPFILDIWCNDYYICTSGAS